MEYRKIGNLKVAYSDTLFMFCLDAYLMSVVFSTHRRRL